MSDSYIDQDETQIYGPYAAKKIRTVVMGLQPECDAALTFFADEIDHATAEVWTRIQGARDTDSALHVHVRDKQSALALGRDVLGRFSKHLDTHPAGTIDRKRWFTKDGTVHGAGTSAPRVAQALANIQELLGRSDCPVNERHAWLRTVKEAVAALSPALEHADSTHDKRHSTTPEVEAARLAWLSTYKAARSVVEGVLRLHGKQGALGEVFYDLRVPAGAKVTAPPPEKLASAEG